MRTNHRLVSYFYTKNFSIENIAGLKINIVEFSM